MEISYKGGTGRLVAAYMAKMDAMHAAMQSAAEADWERTVKMLCRIESGATADAA